MFLAWQVKQGLAGRDRRRAQVRGFSGLQGAHLGHGYPIDFALVQPVEEMLKPAVARRGGRGGGAAQAPPQ
jgi:hypothetical protein